MKAHARPESAMSGLNSNVVRAFQMRPTTAKMISPNMAHLSATNVIPNRWASLSTLYERLWFSHKLTSKRCLQSPAERSCRQSHASWCTEISLWCLLFGQKVSFYIYFVFIFFCLCGHAKNLALAWMVIMTFLWNAELICCSKSWTRTWTFPAAISHFSFQGDCMGRAFPFGAPAVQVCYRIFVSDWSYRGPSRISNENTPKSKLFSEPFLQPLKGISSVG